MKNVIFSLVVTLLLTGSLAACSAQKTTDRVNQYGLNIQPTFKWPPKHYVCYKAETSIQIDGVLDEEGWQNAEWSEYFLDIMGNHFPKPRYKTKMKMLWDNDYLYIAGYLEEPHLWATITQRDEVIFYDNDFEVFIDPDGDTYGYFELEINALNTVWDLLLAKPYRDGGPAINNWNITGLKSATHLEGTLNDPNDNDRAWSVELAIPLKAINEYNSGPKPADGAHWRINFSRVQWRYSEVNDQYQKDINPETGKSWPEDNWVWSPQGAVDMHRPELWGILQFSDLPPGKNPADFRPDPDDLIKWELRNIYYAQRIYHQQHKEYAEKLTDLVKVGLDLKALKFNPEIQRTFSGFQIRGLNPNTQRQWLVDEGGQMRSMKKKQVHRGGFSERF